MLSPDPESQDHRNKNMSNYYTFKPSVGDASQYQAAGRPFVATGTIPPSTTVAINFPTVTKSFTINKYSGKFGFDPGAPAANLMNLPGTQPPFTLELKCRTLYLINTSALTATDYEILAELTGIEEEYILSGSGINTP
jgi:hypothetical protein